MKKSLLICLAPLVVACGSNPTQGVEPGQKLQLLEGDGGAGATLTVVGCQQVDEPGLEQACIADSEGKTYAFGGRDMVVTASAPPYGSYLRFKGGFAPNPADISTEGTSASVRAYAAMYNVEGNPCCAEMGDTSNRVVTRDALYDESHRVNARAQLDDQGGLLVTVHEPFPAGTQIAIILEYSALYRTRLTPPSGGPCDLPGDLCSELDTGNGGLEGFTSRFYVGAVPAVNGTPESVSTKGSNR